MLEMFGLSLEQQAKGEKGNLNRTRQDFNDWDFGDRFRSLVTGQSKESVQKRAAELARDDINESSAGQRSALLTGAKGTGIDVGDARIRQGESLGDYEARLTSDKSRVGAAQTLQGMRGGSSIELDPTAGIGTINSAISGLKETNRQADKQEVKTETIRQETRGDKIRADAYLDAAKIRSDDRAAQREDNRLTRDLSMLSGDREMAIAQMNSDLADKRMDYDRETRRMDKRSQAIAQLMSGLGSLGGAFSL